MNTFPSFEEHYAQDLSSLASYPVIHAWNDIMAASLNGSNKFRVLGLDVDSVDLNQRILGT